VTGAGTAACADRAIYNPAVGTRTGGVRESLRAATG
jgi:hypothetical protein